MNIMTPSLVFQLNLLFSFLQDDVEPKDKEYIRTDHYLPGGRADNYYPDSRLFLFFWFKNDEKI